MRNWFLLLFLILSMLIPSGVHAQEPVSFNALEIDLWPEYDKPSMLVIYRMTLSASTPYPASVSVHIPAAAGEPFALAVGQDPKSLYVVGYTRKVEGDWAIINFTAAEPVIELDYYDTRLIKDGTSRHFQYEWFGDYAVSQLTIQVQQPTGATGMHISPSLGGGVVGGDNFTYYSSDIGAVPAGQNINITLDYQKPDDSLSAETMPLQPSAPIPQSVAPELNVSTWLPWILGILGAGLIIGGIVWFVYTGRQRPASQTRRRRAQARPSKAEAGASDPETAVYCSKCGKRALVGDQFCRSCGTPIRYK